MNQGWPKNKPLDFYIMADSKKLSFSIPPILNIFFQKFHGLVIGLVGLIDVKGIDVAQPIWLSDCPM